MNKYNYFIEGIPGSGKTTLLNTMADNKTDYTVYREGDISPVELAWCAYMTKEQYEEYEKLGTEILDTLEAAFDTKDPAGELAQKTCELHRKWLSFTWKDYSKEAHSGLAQMYVCDERFTAYYDKRKPGMAQFLSDAITIYTGTKQ